MGDVHTVRDIDPDEPENMLLLLAKEYTQAGPQSFCLNDVAARNIADMSVTLDTSHAEMSELNSVAHANISAMVVTLDTSHFEMSPLNKFALENM